MRPVGAQNNLGSCTGWGGTAAVEAARQDGIQRSPLYVYYWDRQEDGTLPDQDSGATMLALCKALRNYGAPPEDVWPYIESRYSQRPSAEADQAAAECRVESFYQVQGQGQQLLQGMWAAVQEGPFPIALKVFESFEHPDSQGRVPMPSTRETVLGGHCICCCGWINDNSAPGGYGWFDCQNSWGAMGDSGYWRLPAGYVLQNIVVEAHVLKLAAAPVPAPEDNVDPAIYEEIQEAIIEASMITGNLDTARYQLRASDPNTAWTYVGEGARLQAAQRQRLVRVLELLPKDDGGVDPPPPPPTPEEDWANLLSGAPGLAGRSKWLAGSTGVDIFVHRGTMVRAPHDCRVSFNMIPVPGVGAIGEMVLTYPDGRAIRFRHVSNPKVQNGTTVQQGAELCVVYDATMDQLRWPRGYPTPPDGYQHLDVSLATSVSRLNPQGGAGGDVDADAHIWSKGGLPNITMVDRTPGPAEGSMSGQLAAAWLAWTGETPSLWRAQ